MIIHVTVTMKMSNIADIVTLFSVWAVAKSGQPSQHGLGIIPLQPPFGLLLHPMAPFSLPLTQLLP